MTFNHGSCNSGRVFRGDWKQGSVGQTVVLVGGFALLVEGPCLVAEFGLALGDSGITHWHPDLRQRLLTCPSVRATYNLRETSGEEKVKICDTHSLPED